MKVTSYSQEDLMPLVLSVLRLAEIDYLWWSLKIGLRGEFIDLKGLIDGDIFDDETISLLYAAKDERIKVLLSHATKFQVDAMAYANLFAIDLPLLYDDPRLRKESKEFYLNFFPNDGGNEFDRELYFFYLGMAELMNFLCELVINGSVNLEDAFGDNFYEKIFDGHWDHYIESEDHAYRFVAVLMKDTRLCYDEMIQATAGDAHFDAEDDE